MLAIGRDRDLAHPSVVGGVELPLGLGFVLRESLGAELPPGIGGKHPRFLGVEGHGGDPAVMAVQGRHRFELLLRDFPAADGPIDRPAGEYRAIGTEPGADHLTIGGGDVERFERVHARASLIGFMSSCAMGSGWPWLSYSVATESIPSADHHACGKGCADIVAVALHPRSPAHWCRRPPLPCGCRNPPWRVTRLRASGRGPRCPFDTRRTAKLAHRDDKRAIELPGGGEVLEDGAERLVELRHHGGVSIEIVAVRVPAIARHFHKTHSGLEHSPGDEQVPAKVMAAVALDIALRQFRSIEDVRAFHQLAGGVEDVAVRLRVLWGAMRRVAFVESRPQFIALVVLLAGQRGIPQQVFRRLAVAKGQRAIFRPKEPTILRTEPAVPRLDPHIRRELALTGAEQFGHGGTKIRVGHAARLRVAALDAFDTGGMRVVLCAQAAHHAHPVHLLRQLRHEFGEMDARHARRDAAKRSAKSRVRLRIPALELADPAIKPQEEDLLVALAHFLRGGPGEQSAQPAHRQRPDTRAEKTPARHRMFPRSAERVVHRLMVGEELG